MDRYTFRFAWIGLAAVIGCGSQVTEKSADPGNTVSPSGAVTSTTVVPSPTDVVSQFLDLVRRGGEDSGANDLLTLRAQAELKRIGRAVQPIGSPDAGFEVTRAEAVPDQENAALVHSIWSEPNPDGSSSKFQVVWALQKETRGWRISGLAMEIEPGKAPMIIDFENGDRMAMLLSDPPESPNSSTETSQAPEAGTAISR